MKFWGNDIVCKEPQFRNVIFNSSYLTTPIQNSDFIYVIEHINYII
jgi:hypothetical protein